MFNDEICEQWMQSNNLISMIKDVCEQLNTPSEEIIESARKEAENTIFSLAVCLEERLEDLTHKLNKIPYNIQE